MTSFSAQVDDWVKKSKERMEAVFKTSVQDTIEIMQTPVAKGGNMPVDTGFLRSTLQTGLNAPVLGPSTPTAGGNYSYNGSQATMTIASADLGDSIFATYSANYARFVHDGANGRPGRPFVTLAAQRWQQTVNKAVAEAKSRIR